jgi:hypothetical protein
MAHPVIYRSLIADAWVQSSVIPRDKSNLKIGLGSGFSPSIPFSPVSIIPPLLHTHLHLNPLIRRTNVRCLGTFKQRTVLPDIWELWAEKDVAFVYVYSECKYIVLYCVCVYCVLYRHVLMCLKQWQGFWGQMNSTLLRKLWVGVNYVRVKINFLSLFLNDAPSTAKL